MNKVYQKQIKEFASVLAERILSLEKQIIQLRKQSVQKEYYYKNEMQRILQNARTIKSQSPRIQNYQSILINKQIQIEQNNVQFKHKQLQYLEQIKKLSIQNQSLKSLGPEQNKKHYLLINQIKNQYQFKINNLEKYILQLTQSLKKKDLENNQIKLYSVNIQKQLRQCKQQLQICNNIRNQNQKPIVSAELIDNSSFNKQPSFQYTQPVRSQKDFSIKNLRTQLSVQQSYIKPFYQHFPIHPYSTQNKKQFRIMGNKGIQQSDKKYC